MGILTMLRNLPSPAVYALSVGLEKGVSLFMIPLVAAFVPPDAYGRFDVAVSLVEFVSLIAQLGIGFTLIRFASIAETEAEARLCGSELLGNCLLLALIWAVVVQLLAVPLASALSIEVDMWALRAILLAATMLGLIDLPLMWLRLKDRALLYMAYVLTRAIFQLVVVIVVLNMGYGITGMLYTNAAIQILFAAALVVLQWRETGVRLSFPRFQQMLRYGVPLVGAGLAMFALGNANRLFLPGHVPEEAIGHFGLAARLALAAWLLMYPFDLWWHPKRIAALVEPNGLDRSRQVWGIGFSIMVFGALAVGLTAPLFIEFAFPASYKGALIYLPFLLIAMVLHQVAILSATGSFAQDNGYSVFSIDLVGASLAIAGYVVLVPQIGAIGAAYAMMAGNFVRLLLYVWFGRKKAPIDYPWIRAMALFTLCALLVAFAPPPEQSLKAIAWVIISLLLSLIAMLYLKLVPLPVQLSARPKRA